MHADDLDPCFWGVSTFLLGNLLSGEFKATERNLRISTHCVN